MDVRILCNERYCTDEVSEHAYCDPHQEEKIQEAFDRGKKEGHDEGYQEAKEEYENTEEGS